MNYTTSEEVMIGDIVKIPDSYFHVDNITEYTQFVAYCRYGEVTRLIYDEPDHNLLVVRLPRLYRIPVSGSYDLHQAYLFTNSCTFKGRRGDYALPSW